ncbi:cation-transporting P-type ATPase [Pannonibacter tanglangensis]|uniref:HAD-IC family P-type ATPase n=1 Tax=Pannonibacter tanglangensis TaxID=2750084 RepID=A0ABW9ZDZ8_9HYPH|nr:cation-transporting P-type ATPase [Pannonibacter sp. XCT-34]NBN63068.1 HAD-IC family P-type ATPase [Pannonibacter sp. XCT-34]
MTHAPHADRPDDVLAALSSSPTGLTGAEAQERLARHGPNRLPQAVRRSPLRRFLAQFNNILIHVLIGSAAVTAALGHAVDSAVILAVVLGNAVIGFLQEGKAEQAMAAIRNLLAPRAAVLRDGMRQTVASETLVPGDVVLLEAGDKVPADLRLLWASRLQVEEALLTGESVPVEKAVEPVATDVPLGDRSCMAYSGTMVTQGTAGGVVVATGRQTEIGHISRMLSSVETLTTPLVVQMDRFARWLTAFILTVAALILVFGALVLAYPFTDLFMAVVGLSVAAIPEGLPAVLTITLAVGVKAMARRNAIVRRLPAIETIGAVSVICTDKTGTLTRNEMMVASVAVGRDVFSLGGDGYAPSGPLHLGDREADARDHRLLLDLAEVAALCNDAAIRSRSGAWHVEGDPMEGALLAFAGKIGLAPEAGQAGWQRMQVIPFDARHRYMATLDLAPAGDAVLHLKGAPEAVLALCEVERRADGTRQPTDTAYWQQVAHLFAGRGERVLALAARSGTVQAAAGRGTCAERFEGPDLLQGLELIGLVGLIDPPRPEAVAAVAECRAAGISVKMITGDHAVTAAAIGRQVGLAHPDRVLTGADLDRMSEPEIRAAVLETDVFARTSPAHKLQLVKALQAHGLTVAMTGDGVNDAPALKRADAGIAMGQKGSEATREAAQLVLADDNFASIVAAVREGRTVHDNIRKVIAWTLPTSTGQALTIVAALLAGLTLPVTPVQVLWVNLITAVTLGLALAFEPSEPRTMMRPPRPRSEPIITPRLIWHIVLVGSLMLAGVSWMFTQALARGYPVELARTLAVNTLVAMEVFHLFNVRKLHGTSLTWTAIRGTRVIWLTIGLITAAQAALTYLPPLQQVFGTAAVPLADGLQVVGLGVALFVVVEVEKQIRFRLHHLWAGRPQSRRLRAISARRGP